MPHVCTQSMSAPIEPQTSDAQGNSAQDPVSGPDSDSESESPPRQSDSESTVEASEDECTPCFLAKFVVNPKSGCYHAPKNEESNSPHCNVPCKGLQVVDSVSFHRWRSSRPSSCCSRCFVLFEKSEHPCKHICGRLTPAGSCTRRCAEIHSSQSDNEHDCFQCSLLNQQERKIKRSRRLDAGMLELGSELSEAQAILGES